MSQMSQFFVGSGIKSIQTGYVQSAMTAGTTLSEDQRFIDITINSVSTAKTMLQVDGSAGVTVNMSGWIVQDTGTQTSTLTARLTSSTNLRISARAPHIVCRWQVIEFN
jgi:hypothetical protein